MGAATSSQGIGVVKLQLCLKFSLLCFHPCGCWWEGRELAWATWESSGIRSVPSWQTGCYSSAAAESQRAHRDSKWAGQPLCRDWEVPPKCPLKPGFELSTGEKFGLERTFLSSPLLKAGLTSKWEQIWMVCVGMQGLLHACLWAVGGKGCLAHLCHRQATEWQKQDVFGFTLEKYLLIWIPQRLEKHFARALPGSCIIIALFAWLPFKSYPPKLCCCYLD